MSASSGPPQPIPTALDLLPAESRLLDGTTAEREQPLDPVCRALFGQRRLDDEREHAPGPVDEPGGELRAADVEPEYRRVHSVDADVLGRGERSRASHQPLRPWVAIPSTK